jgi:hypothetical protein
MIPIKTVYVNDVPIGQASNWSEAEKLLAEAGISFLGKAGASEGPTAFFIYGTRAISAQERKGRTGQSIG